MEKIYTSLLLVVAAATIVAAVSHFAETAAEEPMTAMEGARIQAHELAVSGIDYASYNFV